MKTCNCGAENEDNATFCWACCALFSPSFDDKAKDSGWELLGYDHDGTESNPDGTPIFMGQAIYRSSSGTYADAHYIQEHVIS